MKPRPGDVLWLIAELARFPLSPRYHTDTDTLPSGRLCTADDALYALPRLPGCNAHNHRRRVCTRCSGCPTVATHKWPHHRYRPPRRTPLRPRPPSKLRRPSRACSWCTSTGPSRASGPRLWTRCAARASSRRARRRCSRPRPRAAPPARADAKAADQRREKAEADAEALRAQLADAEARHRAARDAWALKEKKLRAAAAPRDEPPATILDRLVDAVARRPDAEAEELEAWASRARQFQRAVEERIRDTGATPRPPTAAEPPTPAKTAEPSSLQDTYAAGQTIPGDEMEKLLLQYTRAKETRASTLERGGVSRRGRVAHSFRAADTAPHRVAPLAGGRAALLGRAYLSPSTRRRVAQGARSLTIYPPPRRRLEERFPSVTSLPSRKPSTSAVQYSSTSARPAALVWSIFVHV